MSRKRKIVLLGIAVLWIGGGGVLLEIGKNPEQRATEERERQLQQARQQERHAHFCSVTTMPWWLVGCDEPLVGARTGRRVPDHQWYYIRATGGENGPFLTRLACERERVINAAENACFKND